MTDLSCCSCCRLVASVWRSTATPERVYVSEPPPVLPRKRTPPREYPVAVRDDPRWAMLQRARAALRAGDARAYKGLYQLYMRWDELAPLALALQSWARARGARREFVARKRAALALQTRQRVRGAMRTKQRLLWHRNKARPKQSAIEGGVLGPPEAATRPAGKAFLDLLQAESASRDGVLPPAASGGVVASRGGASLTSASSLTLAAL